VTGSDASPCSPLQFVKERRREEKKKGEDGREGEGMGKWNP